MKCTNRCCAGTGDRDRNPRYRRLPSVATHSSSSHRDRRLLRGRQQASRRRVERGRESVGVIDCSGLVGQFAGEPPPVDAGGDVCLLPCALPAPQRGFARQHLAALKRASSIGLRDGGHDREVNSEWATRLVGRWNPRPDRMRKIKTGLPRESVTRSYDPAQGGVRNPTL